MRFNRRQLKEDLDRDNDLYEDVLDDYYNDKLDKKQLLMEML